jgi:hypothetical protein
MLYNIKRLITSDMIRHEDKCELCGSTEIRIDLEGVQFLDEDTVTRTTGTDDTISLEVVFSNPRCATCAAPRTDITGTELDRIRVRRDNTRPVKKKR